MKKQTEGLQDPPKVVWQGDLTFIDSGIKHVYPIRIVNTIDNIHVMECRDNKTDAMKNERWLPIKQIYR